MFFLSMFATGPVAAAEPRPSPDAVELTGYARSCRTVWWSADGARVGCDFEDIVTWDVSAPRLLSQVPIPGYSTHRSFVSSDATLWMQGNVMYDDPARRDITRTHPNLNRSDLHAAVTSQATGSAAFEIGIFVPLSRTAFVVVQESGKYQVRRLDADTGELSTVVYSESDHGGAVPAALDVSDDGKRLAIGLAGKVNGVLLYALPDTHPRLLKTAAEVTAVDLAGTDLFSVTHGGGIQRWGPDTKAPRVLPSPGGTIRDIAVHPSGAHAVVSGTSGAYWIALDGPSEPTKLTKSGVLDTAFSPDGTRIALGLNKRISDPRAPSALVFEIR